MIEKKKRRNNYMKTIIAVLFCLLLIAPVLAEPLGKHEVFTWKCDGCGIKAETLTKSPPEGWIEAIGGHYPESIWIENKDDWVLQGDFLIGIGSSGYSEKRVRCEYLHFCEQCRRSPEKQAELGRRLMETGWWDIGKKPKEQKHSNISWRSDGDVTVTLDGSDFYIINKTESERKFDFNQKPNSTGENQ